MNILITGGAGFIGSCLAQYHLNRNDNVIVIDDLSTGSLENIHAFIHLKNFKFIQNALTNVEQLTPLMESIDRVYHFAAKVGVFNVCDNPTQTLFTNIQSTYILFEAIRQAKIYPQVVFSSTSEVYGNHCTGIEEHSELSLPALDYPANSYVLSKLSCENIVLSYYQKYKIPTTVLRLFNIIGANQRGEYGMVLPRFIEKAISDQPLEIFGDGTQTRSFCDIRDFVSLTQALLQSPLSKGEVFNIGNTREISISQLAKTVIQTLNSKSKITYHPYEEIYSIKYTDTQRRVPNIDKILRLTNYQFEYTLENTIEYSLKNFETICV